MKKIICIDSEKQITRCLKQVSVKEGAYYYSYTRLSSGAVSLFEGQGVKTLPKPKLEVPAKNQFIHQYSQLMVKLGKLNCHQKAWWATDTASKNRFSSRLPMCLEALILFDQLVTENEFSFLIVIGQPWETMPVIQDSFQSSQAKVIYLGNNPAHAAGLFWARTRHVLAIFSQAFKLLTRRHICYSMLGKKYLEKIKGGKYDYAIKTFTYNHCFQGDGIYKEAFFGRLPDYLKTKHKIFIFTSIIGDYRKSVKALRKVSAYPLIPYEMTCSVNDVFKAAVQALSFRVNIKDEFTFFHFKINSLLERIVLEKIQFPQLCHYYATKTLLEMTSTRHFLLTYENYPWERLCILAIRDAAPNTRIVGYQHTVVPEAFLNMFVTSDEREIMPLPDKVLTTGEIPKNIMSRYSDKRINFEPSCALRFDHLFNNDLVANGKKSVQNILVALEIMYESFEMIEYILKELKSGQNYQIKIRTHPALPWERFEKRFNIHIQDYPNVSISKANFLKDDLAWADVIIYSGTTVGVEALAVGKPIIHFDRGMVLSFDPLFQCDQLKWTVNHSQPLLDVLEEIGRLGNDELKRKRLQAREYTRRYFFSNDEANLMKFIG